MQYFDFTSLGQDTISVPILDMGMEFICFFGGSYDGDYDGKYRQGLIIPTDVCNQHKGTNLRLNYLCANTLLWVFIICCGKCMIN